MTEDQVFYEAVNRLGWDMDSQICVLLDYIRNQQSPDAFCDYIETAVDFEESALEVEHA